MFRCEKHPNIHVDFVYREINREKGGQAAFGLYTTLSENIHVI